MPTPAFVIALVAALVVCAMLAAAVARLVADRRRLAAEIVETRRLFAVCMDLAPFAAFIKDTAGRYLYLNQVTHDLMQKEWPQVASFVGRTDHDIFPAEVARSYAADDQEVLQHRCPRAFDESSISADGTVREWFAVKFPWIHEDGRACVAGIAIDTSEVQRAHEAVKVSEDRCSLALEAGRMGTMTLDLATQILETSPLFAVLHGRPATKTRLSLEESLADVHPEDRQSILDAVTAAIKDQAPARIAYRVVRPDGGISWIELVGQIDHDEQGRPTIARGVGFDVTEQRTAYEELARRKAVLRRLIEVQENERQTLCHELHDGMLQYAIGAMMLLESLRSETEAAGVAERLDAAIDCLSRGIAEGRQVIRGVRSAVLDDLGLVAAIHDLAEQMAAAGITVETHCDTGLDALPSPLRTTVYRVVQESLTNIRKHSGCDRATVEIHRTGDEVHLRVCDRGKGFDVDAARSRGFGVVGMAERVRLVGGTCWVESQPGSGTQVNARLPIAPAGPNAAAAAAAKQAYAAAAPAF